MATQLREAPTLPRAERDPDVTVLYTEVPRWLKNAAEDEVILEKRSGGSATLTSFTKEALIALINSRRRERGLPPVEEPTIA